MTNCDNDNIKITIMMYDDSNNDSDYDNDSRTFFFCSCEKIISIKSGCSNADLIKRQAKTLTPSQ